MNPAPMTRPSFCTPSMTHFLFLSPRALCAGLSIAAALLLGSAVQADDGHDHGAAPAVASGPALPRFSASSELFELVGVLDGKQLTLYLDHAPTNAPVKDATLELEIGNQKLQTQAHGEGQFEATLAQALPEGVSPVTATVTAGSDSDLLAGELDIHGDTHAEPGHAHGWKEYALWGLGGIAALALAIAALRLARRKAGAA